MNIPNMLVMKAYGVGPQRRNLTLIASQSQGHLLQGDTKIKCVQGLPCG